MVWRKIKRNTASDNVAIGVNDEDEIKSGEVAKVNKAVFLNIMCMQKNYRRSDGLQLHVKRERSLCV